MNCPKCNFNNIFGNYCRKCGSSLNVTIAFPAKVTNVPNNSESNIGTLSKNDKNINKKNLPKSTVAYQNQYTLNSSNNWHR